ncbi:MAG TPA: class I SAM-dependent methyltransferase [Rudaea sp.]|nr:class I SAM-dependent methyltransferase [Rudaea sp.]
MAISVSLLRRWLKPLRHTPFHPQWFAFRGEARTRAWVHEQARGRVLDIGCADGWVRNALDPECEYVGLDYPVTTRTMYGTRPDVFADGAFLPFRDASFQCVTLLEVLEHVAHPDLVLREAQRVLAPGGTLLLSMPFLYPLHDAPHDYQRYTAPGLEFALHKAGFDCEPPVPRNGGFEAAAMLLAIASAGTIVSALRTRRWRLLLCPLLIMLIPCINCFGWILSAVGPNDLMAAGFRTEAYKPGNSTHV